MNPAQRRASADSAADTRRALIEATRALAAGPHPLTSRAIAAAAGANLASITYYFGSKEALVDEALLSLADELVDQVLAALRAPGDLVARLGVAVARLNELLATHRREAAAYVQVLAAGAAGAPIAGRVRELLRGVERELAAVIAEQQAAGALPGWVRPAPMAQLIVAAVNGVILGGSIDDEFDHRAVAAAFAGLLVGARR